MSKNCGCNNGRTVKPYTKRRNCNSVSPCTNACGTEMEYSQLVAVIKHILQCEFKDLNIDVNLDIYKVSKETYDRDPYWHDEINRIYNKMEDCGPDDPELNKIIFMLVQRTDWLKEQLKLIADNIANNDLGWVRDVLNLDLLRDYVALRDQQQVLVKDKGLYWADFSDTTSADDNDKIIVSTNGVRWKWSGALGGSGTGFNLGVTNNGPQVKDATSVPTRYVGAGSVMLTTEDTWAMFDHGGRTYRVPAYDVGPAQGGGGGATPTPPTTNDKYVNKMATEDTSLVTTMTDNQEHRVDLKAVVTKIINDLGGTGGGGGTDTYINSGSINNQFNLELLKNSGDKVTVDLSSLITKITNNILGTGYRVVTTDVDYTLTTEDMNGHTLVRANKAGDQKITIPKPATEEAIGRTVIIRKTAGDIGTFVTLEGATGVSLSPDDSTLLRRVGSAITLVYVGLGKWDIFGELP